MKNFSNILGTVLLLLIFTSTIFAQSDNGIANKSNHSYFVWSGWYLPVYCDGVQVDYLSGSVSVHWIDIKTGKGVKANAISKGEAVSTSTGEVFRISEVDFFDWSTGAGNLHVNLIGNNGTHYVARWTFDAFTGNLLHVDKAVCPGN